MATKNDFIEPGEVPELDFHQLTIRQKPEDRGWPAVSNKLDLLIDGKPLKGCTGLIIEIEPGSFVRATVQLLVGLDVEANVNLVKEEYRDGEDS